MLVLGYGVNNGVVVVLRDVERLYGEDEAGYFMLSYILLFRFIVGYLFNGVFRRYCFIWLCIYAFIFVINCKLFIESKSIYFRSLFGILGD